MNKKAFTLIEMILSLIIIGILTTTSMMIYQNFFELHENEYKQELYKLELLNTQIFLEKNLAQSSFNTLILQNKKLFFQNSLLLNNISFFEKNQTTQGFFIKICLDKKVCKEWIIQP